MAVILLSLAPAARAGHIASRFWAPPPPDPEWENQVRPQVSQDGAAWQVGGDDDFMLGYVWRIGTPAAVERNEFRWASSFDYANWDLDHVVVYCLPWEETPDEVWVSNGTISRKLAGGTNDARSPRISGTMVVWEERVSGSWDIHATQIDIDTLAPGKTWIVCHARGDQKRPDVDGDLVVWQDRRYGQWDIFARRLSLGPTKRLTTGRAKQTHPRVRDAWVVWQDYRNRGYGSDIYARKARQVWSEAEGWHWKLGAVRTVCHARKNQLEPDVGSGFIVWTDWRKVGSGPFYEEPPDTDIRGYDIRERERFRITAGGMQKAPDIEYRTVVYADYQSTHMSRPWGGRIRGAVLQH